MNNQLASQHKNLAESPGFMLWRVTNAWQRARRAALQATGLTHTQFVLLASLVKLHETQPHATPKMVAEFANTDIMMSLQVLRALGKKPISPACRIPPTAEPKVLPPSQRVLRWPSKPSNWWKRPTRNFLRTWGRNCPPL